MKCALQTPQKSGCAYPQLRPLAVKFLTTRSNTYLHAKFELLLQFVSEIAGCRLRKDTITSLPSPLSPLIPTPILTRSPSLLFPLSSFLVWSLATFCSTL